MEFVDLDQTEIIFYNSDAIKNIKNIKNELINRQQIIIREEEDYYWNNGSL
jgi:hypothetical protein